MSGYDDGSYDNDDDDDDDGDDDTTFSLFDNLHLFIISSRIC